MFKITMVDLSFLKQFTKGDTTKMKRYITMYLKNAPEIFEHMHSNIKSQKWKDLAINAHSLKPQADFIGTKELKEVLILIENAVNNNDTSNLSIFYENAYQIHQKTAAYLQEYIESV